MDEAEVARLGKRWEAREAVRGSHFIGYRRVAMPHIMSLAVRSVSYGCTPYRLLSWEPWVYLVLCVYLYDMPASSGPCPPLSLFVHRAASDLFARDVSPKLDLGVVKYCVRPVRGYPHGSLTGVIGGQQAQTLVTVSILEHPSEVLLRLQSLLGT